MMKYTIYASENRGFSQLVCKYKNYKIGSNCYTEKTHEIRKKNAVPSKVGLEKKSGHKTKLHLLKEFQ